MLETTNHYKAPKEEVESLLTLYYQGKFHLILEKEEQFTFLYPDSIEVINLFGSTNIALQQYQKAIINFKEMQRNIYAKSRKCKGIFKILS